MARSLRRIVTPRIGPRRICGVALGELTYASSTLPGVLDTNFYKNSANDYAYIARKGFKIVRLSFLWERLQPTVGGDLDTTYKGYIDDNIGWAQSNGLKIILDVHNYGGRDVGGQSRKIGSAELSVSDYTDFITKLVTAYKDNPTIYAYEIMNEPANMPVATTSSNFNTTASWTVAAQAGIDAVRALDTEKYILVDTDNFSNLVRFFTDHGENPTPWYTDPSNKLYYTVHHYFSTTNNGQYSGANTYFSGTGYTVYRAGDLLLNVLEWAKVHGVRIAITEFAVPNNDSAWNTALDDFLKVADMYNDVLTTYWMLDAHSTANYNIAPLLTYTKDKPQMVVLEKHLGVDPY